MKKNDQHPFKYGQHRHLEVGDFTRRQEFAEGLLISQEVQLFFEHIIWSDEPSFSNKNIFNGHNTHYWSTENLQLFKPRGNQRDWKFSIWVGIVSNTIIGPFFYTNLNDEQYLRILRQMEKDYLDNLPLNDVQNSVFSRG